MNTRDDFKGMNGWRSYVNRKHGMEYSRHLCEITASATLMVNNRPRRAFSDTEVLEFQRQSHRSQYEDFRKRKLTLGGQRFIKGLTPQRQIYNTDKKFHRKFGRIDNGMEEAQYNCTLSPMPHQGKRKGSPRNSIHCRIDDDDRSFCDSVSSVVCSDFTNAGAKKPTKWAEDELSHKNAKLDAILSWLQHLPKPS